MPSWGNTDNPADKPHFPEERQVRPFTSLVTANATLAGSNTITFSGTGATTAANVGIVPGMWVYGPAANLSYSGESSYFKSNNIVTGTSNTGTNNQVFLSKAATATIPAGTTITFDTAIGYNNAFAANTFDDTVIIGPSRRANATNFSANAAAHTGWVRVKTGTGGRVGRVQVEVLVALANVQTSNTLSGNTSNSLIYFAGL